MTARVAQLPRWPLWSWRNLTVTAFAALVLFGAIGRLTTTNSSTLAPDTSADASARTTTAAAAPSAPPTTPFDVPSPQRAQLRRS